MALVVCRVCQRHVKPADSACPFCGASMPTGFLPGLGGALVLGIGLAVACGGDPEPTRVCVLVPHTGGAASGGHTAQAGAATGGLGTGGTSGGASSGGSASGGG